MLAPLAHLCATASHALAPLQPAIKHIKLRVSRPQTQLEADPITYPTTRQQLTTPRSQSPTSNTINYTGVVRRTQMSDIFHLTQISTIGRSPVSLRDIIYKEAAVCSTPGNQSRPS